MTLHYRSAGRTDIGKIRKRNEDAILVQDRTGLWVVADGLGGHAAGDYASRMIVERLGALPRTGNVFDFIESIEDTLCGINTELRTAARARNVDIIGSTVVLLVHDKDFMLCGWVGDSRAYCHQHGRLEQISRDHVAGVKDDVTQFGAGSSQPNGGALTRAVGAEDQLFVDWVVADSLPGTHYVLCSDGINKEMTDAEIDAANLRHDNPQGMLEELFDVTLGRSARDNASAVVVYLED